MILPHSLTSSENEFLMQHFFLMFCAFFRGTYFSITVLIYSTSMRLKQSVCIIGFSNPPPQRSSAVKPYLGWRRLLIDRHSLSTNHLETFNLKIGRVWSSAKIEIVKIGRGWIYDIFDPLLWGINCICRTQTGEVGNNNHINVTNLLQKYLKSYYRDFRFKEAPFVK